MPQQKQIIGVERDYPGAYGWPIYEYLCPLCEEFKQNVGLSDLQMDNGEWHHVCQDCEPQLNN